MVQASHPFPILFFLIITVWYAESDADSCTHGAAHIVECVQVIDHARGFGGKGEVPDVEHHAERGGGTIIGSCREAVPSLVAFEVQGSVAETGSDM